MKVTKEVTIDEEALVEAEKKATTFTLADAIREGCLTTKRTAGWGDGKNTACALTAAYVSLRKRGIL